MHRLKMKKNSPIIMFYAFDFKIGSHLNLPPSRISWREKQVLEGASARIGQFGQTVKRGAIHGWVWQRRGISPSSQSKFRKARVRVLVNLANSQTRRNSGRASLLTAWARAWWRKSLATGSWSAPLCLCCFVIGFILRAIDSLADPSVVHWRTGKVVGCRTTL